MKLYLQNNKLFYILILWKKRSKKFVLLIIIKINEKNINY